MSRSVAFLRAINVGGHTVTMDRLRGIVEAAGLSRVATFIASGNVVFDDDGGDSRDLERRLASRLRDDLGYNVAVFVRSLNDLAAIASHEAFPDADVAAATAYNLAFTGAPVNVDEDRRLQALTTDIDRFHAHGREVYWLCGVRQSQSTFSNAVLERVLERPSTLRSASTVARIVARYG